MVRIQGYPDDYIFYGPKNEQSRQVGDSVPVPFAFHIATSVIKYLDEARKDVENSRSRSSGFVIPPSLQTDL